MKIGFFGTPEIGAYCLEKLVQEFEVLFAVTGEDKPAGRHRHIQAPPVKVKAQELGISVLQPSSLRDERFVGQIAACGAELFVVVAYGKIIPKEVFELPKYKTINLHPSLLPKYRGAAPIEWAIISGERETGVTVQLINEKLDAGDVLSQEKIAIENDMTAGDLYERVKPAGSALLLRTIRDIERGVIIPKKQNDDEATYCGKINRDTSKIEWTNPADAIRNLIRGMNPKPVAWTTFREKIMRIWSAAVSESDAALMPGEIRVREKKRLLVGTGDGVLEIMEIQPETKKPMKGADFINGYRIQEGESFL